MTHFTIIFLVLAGDADLRDSSLRTVDRELTRVWQEGAPARNLRVRSMMELRVELADEALSDRFFPHTSVQVTSGLHPKYRMVPQTKWVEDMALSGVKYRNDYEFMTSDGKPAPRGSHMIKFYNGTNSWSYDPLGKIASQYMGSHLTTRLTLGYYFDMIGFPGKPVGKDRTTAGELDEPYQLDRLIPSGAYHIDGEETIDGVACLILDRPGLDRVWLAKEFGWAIVRREWRWSLNGPIKRRIANSDFREISTGAWIPYKGLIDIFGHPTTKPGRRVGQLRATVLKAEADVADSWFEPDFPKGTLIEDVETGERFRFGMETQSLDSTVDRAARLGPAFRPEAWWLRLQTWIIVAVVLIAVLVGRRWISRRAEASP